MQTCKINCTWLDAFFRQIKLFIRFDFRKKYVQHVVYSVIGMQTYILILQLVAHALITKSSKTSFVMCIICTCFDHVNVYMLRLPTFMFKSCFVPTARTYYIGRQKNNQTLTACQKLNAKTQIERALYLVLKMGKWKELGNNRKKRY